MNSPFSFTNDLIHESSPYLLQHAHNPVNWYPWGDAALQKAKAENKMLIISIGYAACHWCHVMEHESFEDTDVATIMNEHFICIKVDREERPDVDQVYMTAAQLITGRGGWPLNALALADGRPFYAGTYFPKAGWIQLLQYFIDLKKTNPEAIVKSAEQVTKGIHAAENVSFKENEKPFLPEELDKQFSSLKTIIDFKKGGADRAPKFPMPSIWEYLLHYNYLSKNEEALKAVTVTLDNMALGGIYDHLEGGFARYSTDANWHVPHFEKMLYDNSQLVSLYAQAYQLTKDPLYKKVVYETLDFVAHELTSPEGAFYASLDADSEGEEGKYYVWQKEEVDQLLGNDSELFCEFFNIIEQGNWEGKNIPRILQSKDDFSIEKKIDKDQFEQIILRSLEKLSGKRNTRIKPSLDDKIILGWNALMIAAVAKAGIVLQDEFYRELAGTNLNFLQKNFKKDSISPGLFHTYKNGLAKYPAFLDDYAYMIAALLQFYQASFDESHLQSSYELCNYIIENFSDEDSIFFFFTHMEQKDVIVRKKEIYDGATPSGNAVMAENLYRLSVIFDKPDWRVRADKMLEILSPSIIKYPGSFGIWASLLLQQVMGTNEIAVIGADHMAVSIKILLNFIPNMILISSAKENKKFPLLANKPYNESTLIYLCKNYSCLAPFSSTETLIQKIAKTNKITR
jgi:uncharacterized protein